LERSLSRDTLLAFQRAYEIQHAFFQNNGPTPFVQLSVKPAAVNVPGAAVKFEVEGTPVTNPTPQLPPTPPPGPVAANAPPPPTPPPPLQPASGTPTTLQWPGPSPLTRITFAPGPGSPAAEFFKDERPWSMFRTFERGGLGAVHGNTATVRYLVNGQELRYELTSNASSNPLNLALLRDFKCPSGI